MRWLLVKDLQILRRSPLLVALLVLYPIVIAVLIGFALSRGPDKPEIAFVNEVPDATIEAGGERFDVSQYRRDFEKSVELIDVSSEAEARRMVEDGEVLGALVIPREFKDALNDQLSGGISQAKVKVIFNAEDPVKRDFVRDTIKSKITDANAALGRKLIDIGVGEVEKVRSGGQIQGLDVLGLERSRQILERAQRELPEDSPQRAQLEEVSNFARDASTFLVFAGQVLNAIGTPIQAETEELGGSKTPLDSFAVAIAVTVSLMFVTLLLAAGILALEREENAFHRLVRGLVSRTGLLVEKAGLAALCSVAVALVMLVGLALFVTLDWGRFPLWLLALAAGALAFAAMGLAIGGLAREVRAASLLAFMISLPVAFLALVPSGSVSAALFDVIEVISALFPFKATLDAMDAALNDAGSMTGPLLHLLALFAAFGLVARLSLRRFA